MAELSHNSPPKLIRSSNNRILCQVLGQEDGRLPGNITSEIVYCYIRADKKVIISDESIVETEMFLSNAILLKLLQVQYQLEQ